MRKLLALALATLLLATGAMAGTLSPGLQDQIRNMNDSDQITVLVVLQDQVDAHAMAWELHDAKVDNDRQHTMIVSALMDNASKTQGPILDYLSSKSLDGEVRAYRAYWLINAVRVATTVAGARDLAARGDVEVVEADLQAELIEPIRSEKALDKSAAGIGITPGVVAVGARRVWDELGIDGTGALVGILDTGVDGNHIALGSRWRGNFAPASECWFDAIGDGSVTPTDTHYHGTHVMGTITGQAPDDSIGVAPGALWIASNVINQGASGEFDGDVINSLQFMTDPDGNPATTDDVPDVVQNSWGVNENFSGYVDCDSRWWTAIDNCEAAGVVLTWSAGNEGPGSTSLRSPADRATDQYNAFSVGSTIATAPYTISSFSSRGPSGCGGAYATKPEIVAPGSDIYSAQPGGGYQLLSGTSMAGPHVAGVVALMRAAAPDLDVITVKEILMQTAVDLGDPGEENTYGNGFVNAYDAVLAVMSGFGAVEGYVTDASTGDPIVGAAVLATAAGEFNRAATTDGSGYYRFMLPQGTWNFDYSAFGYLPGSQSLAVVEDGTTNGDFTLSLAPQAVVSGHITLWDGATADMAVVQALGTPLAPVSSDAAGDYSISVPLGGTYTFLARQNGYAGARVTAEVTGDMTIDFFLDELRHEDFESGDFTVYPWEFSGTAPWTITDVDPFEGDYCARSGVITHNETSTMSVDLDLNDGVFSFWYKVSSESGYDFLEFYMDGVLMNEWSGVVPWTRAEYPVAAGPHTLTWTYSKDGSVSSNDDAVYVDFIGEPLYPSVTWSPDGLAETLAVGQTSSQYITLGNTGEMELTFTARGVADLPSLQTFEDMELGKDDIDPRHGMSPIADAGGPDDFGYYWIDSNSAGGPTFDWFDISGIGTPQSFTDDSNHSFALPFSFPFYGEVYNSVNVCSNGWLSFTSTSTSYSNAAIPSTSEPNTLVAVVWDDLNPASAGQIYTYEEAGRFIVQWDGVPYYGTSDYQTFQAILNSDGSIVVQLLDVLDRSSGTLGLENQAGDNGLQVVYNAPYIESGLAILYDFQQPWMSLPVAGGVVPMGGTYMLEVIFDATETPVGIYSGNVLIETNDPNHPEIVVPVVLVVTDEVANEDGDTPASKPTTYALHANYPNPFNPMTNIEFELPVPGMTKLAVYDLSGALVRELKNEVMTAARHNVTWDGTNDRGQRVASGTYYLRMNSGEFSSVRKMTLVK
ncbi:MAG TPA: S8 family serine peptidase [Candidatus Krumholzibacteria bacterium]|mgnify:CR=1 FL=1|nr:S8 family serine peptidase [Candidatus Krumholzibacteria bacterium]HRX52574.1 S8 family serine peptidase [Candidatus Krumholzibacteria bacterium]